MVRKLKRRKDSEASAKKPDPKAAARRRAVLITLAGVVCTVAAGVGAVMGLLRMRMYVMSQPAFAQNFADVELVNRPAWMDEWLTHELNRELLGATDRPDWTFDPTLSRRVYERAAKCPWVRLLEDVHVERAQAAPADKVNAFRTGKVLVRAQWRAPVAIAQYGPPDRTVDEYVDEFGWVLPHEQARRLMGNVRLPRIEGIAEAPPSRDGKSAGLKWEGEDLRAGLLMVKELRHRPYFTEITAIDVSNHANRRNLSDPAIRLIAEGEDKKTEIRFGRLPLDGVPIGEPTTARKFANLDGLYKLFGRLAGTKDYMDLRFPDPNVSEN